MLVRLTDEQAQGLLKPMKLSGPPRGGRQSLLDRLQRGVSRHSNWWLLEVSEADAARVTHYAHPRVQCGFTREFLAIEEPVNAELERFELLRLQGLRGWISEEVRSWWLKERQGAEAEEAA